MIFRRFIAGLFAGLLSANALLAQERIGLVDPAHASRPNGGYDVPGVTHWIRNDATTDNLGCRTRTNNVCADCDVGQTPIGTEYYLRVGPSFPVGNEVLGRNLRTGFTVGGGVRALFYSNDYRRAWTLDVGLANAFHSGGGQKPAETFRYTTLVPPNNNLVTIPVGVRNFSKTSLSLGGGREWIFGGGTYQGECCGLLRVGIDGGGRWGSASIEFDRTLRHRTDVVGGMFAGTYANYEFPCWGLIGVGGVRTEWVYTWSDMLQRATDAQEINLLFTAGVRW